MNENGVIPLIYISSCSKSDINLLNLDWEWAK